MCDCEERLFNSQVIDSRKNKLNRKLCNTIYRRRMCNSCGDRFTSYEFVVDDIEKHKKLNHIRKLLTEIQ